MRFDDSLNTILSADMQPGVGAQSAWRQLVDLMSRGRIPADEPTIARLRMLRQAVPDKVRAASARAIAFATPGAALVGLFVEDRLTVAAPLLRTAVLPAADWLAILPRLTPETRSILRHRRDLPAEVVRGLESFGATDFVLGDARDDKAQGAATDAEADATASGEIDPVANSTEAAPEPAWVPATYPAVSPSPDTPLSTTPFVSLGDVARGLPVIAEALRQRNDDDVAVAPTGSGFPIADLVKRIDAFQRTRDQALPTPMPAVPVAASSFRFETDRDGVIRWVDGVARAPLVGMSLAYPVRQGVAQVDAAAGGAIRQRARFGDARLLVEGESSATGAWRIAGEPMFDHATGRFTGYRGMARRPRTDESAAPQSAAGSANAGSPDATVRSDSLRQLVHELRTPTNAIAGFAELIETELLGPVAPTYRAHATTIREQASALIAAIDDLDTLARIDGGALEQRSSVVMIEPLLIRIVQELTPLAEIRGATMSIDLDPDIAARIDDRLGERLVSRLLGAILAAAGEGESIAVRGSATPDTAILDLTRPAVFGDRDADALMRIEAAADGEQDEAAGASLLGIGFTLRLVRNLARELDGEFVIAADRLTLRLPAAVDDGVGQATN